MIKVNEDIIKKNCEDKKFRYQILNNHVFIYSLWDTWELEPKTYHIVIKHKNNYYITKRFHEQFTGREILNWEDAIRYIARHDNKRSHKFNKVSKISEILKKI